MSARERIRETDRERGKDGGDGRRREEKRNARGREAESDGEKRSDRERARRAVRGTRCGGGRRGSVGYRSVRVLLQRPTGQRITRNSRLDSAEFERAPILPSCIVSLCFALGSPRLSPLFSSPHLFSLSPSLSPRWFSAVSPYVYEKLSAGLAAE